MTRHANHSEEWKPLPYWASLTGAGAVACGHAFLISMVAWAAGLLPSVPTYGFTTLAGAGFIYAIGETLCVALVQRFFAQRTRSHAGGGVMPMILQAVLCLACAYLAGGYLLPGPHGQWVLGGAALLVHTVSALYLQDWKPGMDSEEFADRTHQVVAMTKEHFADDAAVIRERARTKMRAEWERKQQQERDKTVRGDR